VAAVAAVRESGAQSHAVVQEGVAVRTSVCAPAAAAGAAAGTGCIHRKGGILLLIESTDTLAVEMVRCSRHRQVMQQQ
jgi:hypothetical protein